MLETPTRPISLFEEIMVVLISDVVAVIVALHVLDQCLKVKIGQLVHQLEHNVLEEFFIKLGRACEHSHVAAVLR